MSNSQSEPQNRSAFSSTNLSHSQQPQMRPKSDSRWVTTEEERSTHPRIAILAVHGMGQQLPFETIDSVSKIIDCSDDKKVGVSSVRQPDGSLLQRAEHTLTGKNGETSAAVHIYEVHWAALTQGRASWLQTLHFVFDSVCKARRLAAGGSFYRWVMNKWVEFKTTQALGTDLFGVVFITALISIQLIGLPTLFLLLYLSKIIDHRLDQFILEFVMLFSFAAMSYGFLKTATTRTLRESRALLSRLGHASIVLFILTMCFSDFHILVILSKLLHGSIIVQLLLDHANTLNLFRNVTISQELQKVSVDLFQPSVILLWSITLATTLLVASKIQSYLGDVAIYVWSNKLNEFFEIRQTIKTTAAKTFRFVYGMVDSDQKQDDCCNGSPNPFYDQVIVVGHSLGSVIAYDALNEIVSDELVSSATDESASIKRTPLFLTFGSPLDKIAFFYQSQAANKSTVRDLFAAHTRPFTVKYKFRPERWVNIYSPSDIISGALDLYDRGMNDQSDDAKEVELAKTRSVINIHDIDANVYLLSHNMYWTNPILRKILLAQCNGELDWHLEALRSNPVEKKSCTPAKA